MQGVVLAAGRGKRLRSVTGTLPKVLVPVGDRCLIDIIVQGLAEQGIRDLVVVTGYRADLVEEHLTSRFPSGIEFRFVRQDPPRGTGDALRCAGTEVEPAPFLLTFGDVVVRSDFYRRMLDRHHDSPEDNLVAVKQIEDVRGGAAVQLDGERIVDLVEKPERQDSAWINAGIFILQAGVFDIVSGLELSPRGEYELTDALIELARRGNLHAVAIKGEWDDVGTPEGLDRATRWRVEPEDMGAAP